MNRALGGFQSSSRLSTYQHRKTCLRGSGSMLNGDKSTFHIQAKWFCGHEEVTIGSLVVRFHLLLQMPDLQWPQ